MVHRHDGLLYIVLSLVLVIAGCIDSSGGNTVEPDPQADAASSVADASGDRADVSPVELVSSAAVLRLDRLLYREGHEVRARLSAPNGAITRSTLPVLLVSPTLRDVESLFLDRATSEDEFSASSGVRLATEGASRPGDGTLRVDPGDTIYALFYPDPVREPSLRVQVLYDAAQVYARGANPGAPQPQVLPELSALGEGGHARDERPHGTILVSGALPLVVALNELVIEETREGDLQRFLRETGGRVLATDAVPGERPQHLVRVDLSRAPMGEFSQLQAMASVREVVSVNAPEVLNLLAIAWTARMEGYAVTLNPRIEFTAPPSPREGEGACGTGSTLSESMTHRDFDVPGVWASMALRDHDRRSVSVAFLDYGFAPNPDYARPGTSVRECSVESAVPEPWDSFSVGVVCGPGMASEAPQVGASLFGRRVWHGNMLVSNAGGVLNDGYGTAGVAGQVMRPMLYKMGIAAYAFEMGLAIRTAVRDGASVINISGGYPCRILTRVGLALGVCSEGDRATFCAVATGGLIAATAVVCSAASAVSWVPILGQVLIGACAVSAAATITASAACFAFLAPGNVRNSLERGVNVALQAGVPVVASAGNVTSADTLPLVVRDIVDLSDHRSDSWSFIPCVIEGVICVGAAEARSDNNHRNTQFMGPAVDIWAPESATYFAPATTDRASPASEHTLHCEVAGGGSSAAASYISGVIATMQATFRNLDPRFAAEAGVSAEHLREIPDHILRILQLSAHDPQLAVEGVRGRLVNPRRAVERAAFEAGGPDLVAMGYDTSFDSRETLDGDMAETAVSIEIPTISTRLGAVVHIPTVSMPGRGGSVVNDVDWYTGTVPSGDGVYQVDVRVTYPRALGAPGFLGAGFGLAGTEHRGDEDTQVWRSDHLFPGARVLFAISADEGGDNVYKMGVTTRSMPPALGDRFDTDDTSINPSESRPNNDVAARAVRLGGTAPDELYGSDRAWESGSRSHSPDAQGSILLRDLSFHRQGDEDWFAVTTAPTVRERCFEGLEINVGTGARVEAFEGTRMTPLPLGYATSNSTFELPLHEWIGYPIRLRVSARFADRVTHYSLTVRYRSFPTIEGSCSPPERSLEAIQDRAAIGRFFFDQSDVRLVQEYAQLPAMQTERWRPEWRNNIVQIFYGEYGLDRAP